MAGQNNSCAPSPHRKKSALNRHVHSTCGKHSNWWQPDMLLTRLCKPQIFVCLLHPPNRQPHRKMVPNLALIHHTIWQPLQRRVVGSEGDVAFSRWSGRMSPNLQRSSKLKGRQLSNQNYWNAAKRARGNTCRIFSDFVAIVSRKGPRPFRF